MNHYCISNKESSLYLVMLDKHLIEIEDVETGQLLNPIQIANHDDGIRVSSNFFIYPDKIETLDIRFEGEEVLVSGCFAGKGVFEGLAFPYDGKTKNERMLEELQKIRKSERIDRTDKEINACAEALLQQMTLQEKIGQLSQSTGKDVSAIGNQTDNTISTEDAIGQGLVGSIINMSGPTVVFEQQKLAVTKSRLGIPLLFCQDVVHGYETIFPIPLAWSCSFNPELVERAMRIAAIEASSRGIQIAYSPMLDIARDPRWGRVSEGNGEDPFLCAQMAAAHVKGFQGNDLSMPDTMMACMKHFIGYSAAEGGRDYNTTEISKHTLLNIYAPPFEAGIRAGSACVMNAFNVLDGMPVVANEAICRTLLRDKMGFKGVLISDFAAVDELMVHGVADTSADAATLAMKASLDIEMGIKHYYHGLSDVVSLDPSAEKMINESVRRILFYKYKMGLMDDPFMYLRDEDKNKIYSEEHLQVSYDLACQSMVLLKNEDILPLEVSKKIALIGPKADSTDLFGPWQFSHHEQRTKTIKDVLSESDHAVIYSQGCQLIEKLEDGIEEAMKVSHRSDIIIICLGESKAMCGEAASKQNIHLPEAQIQLIKALYTLGKPMVLVLVNGRPLILDEIEHCFSAILETWFLGSMAAQSIVDVLRGVVHPSGKLSMTFPRHQGQIPIYYNHLPTGRPYVLGDRNKFVSKYIDGSNEPLYAFGYGLTYTRFEMIDLLVSKEEVELNETMNIKVHATIKNIGQTHGTEVVQLYIRDPVAKVSRPVKELKGFWRVDCPPQETRQVSFQLSYDDLGYKDTDYRTQLERGDIILMVGTSSRDCDLLRKTIKLV